MLGGLTAFVTELRSCGIPITISEHQDSLAALDVVGIRRRDEVREALRTTLVKDYQHFPAFELAFDIYFGPGTSGPETPEPGTEPADDDAPAATVPSLRALHPERLRELVGEALRREETGRDNSQWLGLLADELVSRYGGVEPERPVAGTAAVFRTVAAVDVKGLHAEAIRDMDRLDDGGTMWSRHASQERVQHRRDLLQQSIEASVRRRLVAGRGRESVAATARRVVPEQLDLTSASAEALTSLEPLLQQLGVKLAARIAKLFRTRRTQRLDFRATARESIQYGGTPVELVMRRQRPPKPEVWVIADVSGSMARFSLFTLQLVFAMRSGFSRLRCFAFQDRMAEITELIATSVSVPEVRRRITAEASTIWLDGSSDYGNSFLELWQSTRDQVTGRTIVIIVGDGRNNYHLTNAWVLQRLHEVAGGVYWLNPEPRSAWGSGDSAMEEYERYCNQVVSCRSVAELKQFIDGFQ